ncbi:MAG: ABC transporter ATP-binding protein [Actinobacteria bacterium]|nr:ABC transporter ATP-binding protein [Actinomycetota bacterium]
MKGWEAASQSLTLLPPADRRKLGLVTAIQMLSALLDAAGVALFGIVAALATSTVSGSPLPSAASKALSVLGIDSADMTTAVIQLSVLAGLLLIGKSILSMILTRRVLRFLAHRQAIVSGQLATSLLSRPLVQIQRRQSQETAFALTTGVNAAMLGVLGQSITVLSELSLLGVLAIGLLALDPLVAIFAVGFFLAIALVLQRIMSSRAQRLGQTSSNAEVASTALVQESISGYREVLVSNRRGLYVDRFQALRWQAASVQADLNLMALIPKYVFEIALIVGAGLLAYTQFLFKDAAAAMATIAVFLAAGSRVVPSMLRLQGAALGVRVTSGMSQPTIELAQELAATEEAPTGSEPANLLSGAELARTIQSGYADFAATIELSDVTFAYEPGERSALHHVDLNVAAGSSVALVGPTGAGKSTLADVILGVVQPDSGTVLVGGRHPLEAISTWPGSMAYVPQEVAMATGSIRENVALGLSRDLIDDDLVWDALRRAKLADFLRRSREGLDTIVGEHGVRLSGGQRQRLGIARALYTRPLLLVLDEATSALDAETEWAVVETLQELEGNVTTVTVAHRLATVRHCDVVVYLENGKLVSQGSFDEVVADVPNFAAQARLLGLA